MASLIGWFEQLHCAVDRLLGSEDDRQVLVVDDHQLGRVDRLLTGFSHDHGDRFADITHLVFRQQWLSKTQRMKCVVGHGRQNRIVSGCDRSQNTRRCMCLGQVNLDRRVRRGRPHEYRMSGAVEKRLAQVIDKGRFARDQQDAFINHDQGLHRRSAVRPELLA